MERKLSRYLAVLLLACMLMPLAACASAAVPPSAPQQNANKAPLSPGEGMSGGSSADSSGYEGDGGDGLDPDGIERKVIRNADLSVQTKDAMGLYAGLSSFAQSLGGYEYTNSVNHYGDYSQVNVQYKIPPEKLFEFINYVGDSGELITSNVNATDITEAFYDAQTRVATKRAALERYYALLSEAKNINDIVSLQKTIDQKTEEIEALEGNLRLWGAQVDMATVTISIRQINDPVAEERKQITWNTLSFDDMWYLIKRGFISVVNTIASILQWLAVVLVGYSPLWIILAAGVFVYFKIKKKRKTPKPDDDDGPGSILK